MKFSVRLILLISGCLLSLACTQKTSEPVAVEPEPEPIQLGESGSHPLIFKNVTFRIPTGAKLGEVRIGRRVVEEMRWSTSRSRALDFNVSVTDGLRDLGYDIRDSADTIFDPLKAIKIRYAMAAIVHSAVLDFAYETGRVRRIQRGVGTAIAEVEVQLFDTIARETVYRRRFQGSGEDEGQKPNPIIEAVVDAILEATTDEDFVRFLSKDASRPETKSASFADFEINACEATRTEELPRDLPAALDAIVEIRAGAVVGTGVIVSPDGWIVTAAHVVDDASELWIRFSNGIQVPATLEQSDTRLDVALLRVQGREYPCAPIRAVADDLAIGSEVYTINSPVGEDRKPSVARGVVSGYPEQDDLRLMQTDAAINPGSSGGPVFSLDGSVAGISIEKVSSVEVEGLAFAVPIQDALRYLAVRFRDD